MGALTIPMFFHGVQVVSGDVVRLAPRGLLRWFRKPFLGIIDLRDRSIPYLVRRVGRRVHKLPLDGAPYPASRYALDVFRLPGIDRARASTIAARAAERPGEGVHHPSYDCGRELPSDAELVRDAYRVVGVDVNVDGTVPGPPLQIVRGPQDPPNELVKPLTPEEVDAARRAGRIAADEAGRWVDRGIPRTRPWQQRRGE
jgi:hypothetical protein